MTTSKRYATIHVVDLGKDLDQTPDISQLEDKYPGISDQLCRGDIIENMPDSGYRASGCYMVDFYFDQNQKLLPIIIRLDYELDDYGGPSQCFKGITEFPLDYWDAGKMNINKFVETAVSSDFYWHSDQPFVSVNPEVLGLDKIKSTNDLILLQTDEKYYYRYYKIFTYQDKNYLFLTIVPKHDWFVPIDPIEWLTHFVVSEENPELIELINKNNISESDVVTNSC